MLPKYLHDMQNEKERIRGGNNVYLAKLSHSMRVSPSVAVAQFGQIANQYGIPKLYISIFEALLDFGELKVGPGMTYKDIDTVRKSIEKYMSLYYPKQWLLFTDNDTIRRSSRSLLVEVMTPLIYTKEYLKYLEKEEKKKIFNKFIDEQQNEWELKIINFTKTRESLFRVNLQDINTIVTRLQILYDTNFNYKYDDANLGIKTFDLDQKQRERNSDIYDIYEAFLNMPENKDKIIKLLSDYDFEYQGIQDKQSKQARLIMSLIRLIESVIIDL